MFAAFLPERRIQRAVWVTESEEAHPERTGFFNSGVLAAGTRRIGTSTSR